jgi:hypothetical protein
MTKAPGRKTDALNSRSRIDKTSRLKEKPFHTGRVFCYFDLRGLAVAVNPIKSLQVLCKRYTITTSLTQ